MSLANKLSVYIILLTIAIFCAIGAVFLRYGEQREERLMSLYATLMVDNSVEKLDADFSRVENHLADGAPVVLKIMEHSFDLNTFVERLVHSDSLIMGGCIALRPGLLSTERDSLKMIYVYRDRSGEWKNKQLGDSAYNYTRMDWYKNAVNADRAVWSAPYMDAGGGDQTMVTCSYPLSDADGKFLGVLTADISLSALAAETERVRPINDSYSFILDDKGVYVSHPDQKLVLAKSVFDYSKELGCEHLAEIGKDMIAGHEGTRHVDIGGQDVLVVYQPVPGTGWSICCVCPYESVMSRLDLVTAKALVLLVLGLVILAILIRIVILYSMKPLVRLTKAASEISEGDLNVNLPEMKPSDDIGRLNNAFAEMQSSLRLQMQRLVETTKAKEHIESELLIARNIQMSLVPHTFSPFPQCDNLELFAMIRPAKEVGGDLYDFFIRDSRLFFVLGDVSGKGVPASLFMAVTRTLFRNMADHFDSPAEITTRLNDTVMKDNDTCMFVTMLIGVLDLDTGLLTFCNAGHNPPVIIDSNGAKLLDVEENIPVGVIDGFDYQEERLTLSPDTSFFLYTDGLTEAENASKELYGEERMLAVLSENRDETPRETIERVETSVKAFVGATDQSDDLTMLSLRLNHGDRQEEKWKFANNLSIVEKLPALTESISDRYGLDTATGRRINLVLEEALVNVVNYAYPQGEAGEIELAVNYDRDSANLTFEISDHGVPFDPTEAAAPDLEASVEERPIGGLGIFMVRTLSDGVEYRRSGDRNILKITLTIAKPAKL